MFVCGWMGGRRREIESVCLCDMCMGERHIETDRETETEYIYIYIYRQRERESVCVYALDMCTSKQNTTHVRHIDRDIYIERPI